MNCNTTYRLRAILTGGKDIPIRPIYRCALIISALIASVAFADDLSTATENYLPSEQQVLTFIADTIDWYRRLPTAQRIGAQPADFLFIEDNRSITTNIVKSPSLTDRRIHARSDSKPSLGLGRRPPSGTIWCRAQRTDWMHSPQYSSAMMCIGFPSALSLIAFSIFRP